MARTRLNPEYEIKVDGETYVWRLQRSPQDSGKLSERAGMALAVRHAEGQREAVIEFPAGPQPKFAASRIQDEGNSATVARAITSALAAGWEPLSRGKNVVFVVDANGG